MGLRGGDIKGGRLIYAIDSGSGRWRGEMSERGPTEGFGAWYDEKQGDTGDPWHRTLIDPGLFSLLGTIEPGTWILDVGCGNGYLSRRLAREGARVVGVDRARELIERARAREASDPLGITYHERDAAHLDGLESGTFQVAIANMSLMDIEDAQGAIREIARVVADGGRFVFSMSHPCFDVDNRSTWDIEVAGGPGNPPVVFRKITNYRNPHSERYTWKLGEGQTVITTGYHRSLEFYAHALREAGWVIVDMVEPRPLPEFVGIRIQREWIEGIPLHLVIEARREPRGLRGARLNSAPRD